MFVIPIWLAIVLTILIVCVLIAMVVIIIAQDEDLEDCQRSKMNRYRWDVAEDDEIERRS